MTYNFYNNCRQGVGYDMDMYSGFIRKAPKADDFFADVTGARQHLIILDGMHMDTRTKLFLSNPDIQKAFQRGGAQDLFLERWSGPRMQKALDVYQCGAMTERAIAQEYYMNADGPGDDSVDRVESWTLAEILKLSIQNGIEPYLADPQSAEDNDNELLISKEFVDAKLNEVMKEDYPTKPFPDVEVIQGFLKRIEDNPDYIDQKHLDNYEKLMRDRFSRADVAFSDYITQHSGNHVTVSHLGLGHGLFEGSVPDLLGRDNVVTLVVSGDIDTYKASIQLARDAQPNRIAIKPDIVYLIKENAAVFLTDGAQISPKFSGYEAGSSVEFDGPPLIEGDTRAENYSALFRSIMNQGRTLLPEDQSAAEICGKKSPPIDYTGWRFGK